MINENTIILAKRDFDKHLECGAPNCQSKYTTNILIKQIKLRSFHDLFESGFECLK